MLMPISSASTSPSPRLRSSLTQELIHTGANRLLGRPDLRLGGGILRVLSLITGLRSAMRIGWGSLSGIFASGILARESGCLGLILTDRYAGRKARSKLPALTLA